MKTIKSLYFRNILKDVVRRSKSVIVFILLITLAFSAIGYGNIRKVQYATEKEQIEIEEYNSKISNYDEAILNLEESLELAKNQVNELQKYIDNSIYMRLDSQKIQVISTQYGVLSNNNIENILASLIFFINEGGMMESVPAEYSDLEPEYWKDIIFCSKNGNVLNLTIYHYDADKAKKILNVIEQKLFESISNIAEVQGDFKLEKLNSSSYLKADINITNTQINNKNSLKNYLSNVADFDNKLISEKNSKADFIKKNEPLIITKRQLNVKMEILKYGILGLISGIVLTLGYFMLKYVIGKRIKSKEDLLNSGLNIIGSYCSKSGYTPDLDRSMVDLELWANEYTISKVFLCALWQSETVNKVMDDLMKKISGINLQAQCGYQTYQNVKDLKCLVESKYCILLVQIGKTTYSEIEQYLTLCDKFHVKILGCMTVD